MKGLISANFAFEMAAVFGRLAMKVRCATQRDHVLHPEMNYSQTQLDELDRLTER
jgi:hypothetical protein